MTLQTIIDSDGSCLAGAAMNAKLRDRWSEMFRAKPKESQLSESFTKQWCQEIGSAKVTTPGRVQCEKCWGTTLVVVHCCWTEPESQIFSFAHDVETVPLWRRDCQKLSHAFDCVC